MHAIGTNQAGAREALRFAYGRFSLGQVLVAVVPDGIAAILIGDSPERLRRELADAFPRAEAVPDDDGLAEVVARVCTWLEAPNGEIGLRLALRGSALEQAVWHALRAIPFGETTTYGRIAKSLTLPATAQEVGAACAANRHAIAIPCHRVVKADGSISGYRWGVRRKRALLDREAAA